jgi:hypothetical protein
MASKTQRLLNFRKNLAFMVETNIDYVPMNNQTQFNLVLKNGETVAFYPSTNKWVHNSKVYYGNAEKMWDWVGMMDEAD